MKISPNEDGTYTLYCCNGMSFTGTYQECKHVADMILDGKNEALKYFD